MQRPDLDTLACVNTDCQHYGRTGQSNLTIRKVYGKDGIRLLCCGSCQEEFSERRNTALFNTKMSEVVSEGQHAKPRRLLTISTKDAVSARLLD